MPNRTTRFTADGPPNREVIEPENTLAADTVGRDSAEVKIAMDNPSPSIADDIAPTDVHLDA